MHRLDGVAQRQVAGAILLGIIALKAHHAVSSVFSGVGLTYFQWGLWCFLDTVFLLGLMLYKVPRLTTSLPMTLLFITMAILLNSGLMGFLSKNETPEESYYDPYTSTPIKTDKFAKVETDGTHIVGSHVVHVLPPTIVKLNPNATSYCLKASRSSIDIPILIKGTSPWEIELECFRFDGSKNISKVTISADENRRTGRHVGLYYIPIGEPGICRIQRITESSGNEGKIINSWAEIVRCPSVRWILPDGDSQRTLDRCVDSIVDVSAEVTGTPPLSVSYFKESAKEKAQLFLVSDSIDDLVTIGGPLKDADDAAIGARLRSLSPRTMTLSTELRLDVEGPFFYKIHSVLDGRNNTMVYPDKLYPDGGSDENDLKPDIFVIDSHRRPKAKFKSCDSIKIRSGPDPISAKLPVLLEGDGPWDLVLGYSKPSAPLNESKDMKMMASSRILDVSVSEPGIYVLKSVQDSYCSGIIELPSTCHVQQTLPPSLSVSAEPIEQSCVGAIGALVNVSLTGEPPFWIEYDEVYGDTRTKKFADVYKLRDTLSFKPSKPGTYIYEFKKVGDATYNEGIPIKDVTITQIIHPQSKAWFTNSLDRHLVCVNDTLELEIALSGSGPWTVTYELMFDATKKQFVEKNVIDPTIKVKTPPLSAPGTYILDLIDITDANGCSWQLDTPDVTIEVLAQRPTVSFKCPRPLSLLDGSFVSIPINLAGRRPFSLKYIEERSKTEKEILDASEIDGIRVSEAGFYKLTDVKDKYCAGVIIPPTDCEVSLIPRPSVSIGASEYSNVLDGNHIRRSVCEGSDDHLELLLSGKQPFSLTYTHLFKNGATNKEKTVALEEKFTSKVARLALDTVHPGEHVYRFNHITDFNYKTVDGATPKDAISVLQRVVRKPNAVFVGSDDRLFQCVGDDAEGGIQLQLEGTAPFELVIELKHENYPRDIIRVGNITTSSYRFKPPALNSTGRYKIQLVLIQDASGCERMFDRDAADTSVVVQVSDVARISSLTPASVCVGDIITYTLQGTPPFTVSYDFDGGEVKEVTFEDPILIFFASEAGTVNVRSVCNQLKCCTRPTNLLHVIHELPSAIVDGGYDLVEDIREGDEASIVIEFKGEPPFSFTYRRTELNLASAFDMPSTKKGGSDETFETFTVSGIESKQYVIVTSQEGVFNVVAVNDRYCGYPRVGRSPEGANVVLKH
ncbi:hypothetical protein HDU67_003416 [Dinochytrium kinnereticum]|nr:hypothetical protein HDU67_003416 [Dinochytrium kinnereticum]